LVTTAYKGEWLNRASSGGRHVDGIPAHLWWTGLLLLIHDSGARIGAVLKLTVDHLDLNTGRLFIPAEFQKQFADQTFWLTAETLAIIAQFADIERELLFPWPYDIASLYNRFKALLKFAGLPHGRRDKFHKIRRTTATECEIHVGRGTASGYLGHSGQSVTRAYIDVDQLPESRMAEQLPRPLLIGFQLSDGTVPTMESMLPAPLPAPQPIEHHVAAVILPPANQPPEENPLWGVDPLSLFEQFESEELRRMAAVSRAHVLQCVQRVMVGAGFKTVGDISAEGFWSYLGDAFRRREIYRSTLDVYRADVRRFINWLIAKRGLHTLARVAEGLRRDEARLAAIVASTSNPLMRVPRERRSQTPESVARQLLMADARQSCSPQTTVREFFQKFYVPGRLAESVDRTIAVYIKAIAAIERWAGRTAKLCDLSRENLEAFSRDELERGTAMRTVASRLGVLIAIGHQAHRCEVITVNYVALNLPAELAEFRSDKRRTPKAKKGGAA
jgi:hypothetical protein